MRFIASRLGFDAHLASIEIILDGVSVAHLIVLVLRVIVQIPEQAVSGDEPTVVHPHRVALRRTLSPTVDAAAAQERRPITCVKRYFSAVPQHASHAKRSIILEHNNRK